MKTIKSFSAIFICLLAAVLLVSGCGGGGGGDTSVVDIRPSLCPGIRYETADKKNIIFASVNRSGITGYIETITGTKLAGSDLVSNGQANTSEIMVVNNTPGNYRLVYYVNSERYEITREIQWTILPDLVSPPLYEWQSSNKTLTITHSGLTRGYANFYLRLFYSVSLNTMYYQTSVSQGNSPLMTRVTSPGDYVPVYVADIIEGDQLKGTLRYIFGSTPMY